MYKNEGIEVDVDGACRSDGRVGYAFIVRHQGKEIYRESGLVPQEDPDLSAHRQIGGEIYAVVQALRWCNKRGWRECTIYYDYEGLERWASRQWKARSPLTRRYVAFLQKVPITISWVKVPAHQGCYWNEQVDRLARG
ncbi:MAG: hypothetical protein NZ580_05360 [Bacteroidia bacterium]|nr:hypothetical protein [Bacteroidia bacterium]MDW8235922.1 RNase H family protein [Bacteroidia bacterium]